MLFNSWFTCFDYLSIDMNQQAVYAVGKGKQKIKNWSGQKMAHEHMGQMIASLRKDKNYTQQELADRLGITDKAVSKWERGIAYPDILLIPKLAETLDVTTDILLSAAEASTSSNKVMEHLKSVSGKEWANIVALCLKCIGIVLAVGCVLLNLLGSELDAMGTLIILSFAVICIGLSTFKDK